MQKNDALEIATSLAGGSLTLFLGTGFSKHMTDGAAPSWGELLYECAKRLDSYRENQEIREQGKYSEILFNNQENGIIKCNIDLTICAQILEEECNKRELNVREIVGQVHFIV